MKSPLPDIFSVNSLAELTNQNFILPFYHLVSDEACPHIKNLYQVKTVAQFESDLDFLLKHYTPIAASDLTNVVNGKLKNKKIFLLSFDDGLREVHDIIAPILLRKGVPAIFFLNSDFIDNRALMFRYKVSLLIEQLANDKSDLKKFLKTERTDSALIQETADKLSYKFDLFLETQQPYLTSAQIETLIAQGFSIGAHSCNHPYYEDIPLQEQLRQTFESLAFLQSRFSIKEKMFAFPFTDFGVTRSFFDSVFLDKKLDFSFGGAGLKKDVSPFHFQRLAMEQAATAEQIVRAEYIYYLLKIPFLKNSISRN